MTSLPAWIEDRIDPTLEKKLTQRHVVEVMLESERRFFHYPTCPDFVRLVSTHSRFGREGLEHRLLSLSRAVRRARAETAPFDKSHRTPGSRIDAN